MPQMPPPPWIRACSDQTISLRIINEKHGSTAGEIHSNNMSQISLLAPNAPPPSWIRACSDQTISLRIINEKHGSTGDKIHSNNMSQVSLLSAAVFLTS